MRLKIKLWKKVMNTGSAVTILVMKTTQNGMISKLCYSTY